MVENMPITSESSPGFLTARRKAVDFSGVNLVRESVFSDNESLPLVLEPASVGIDLAGWIATNRNQVTRKLFQHGGILFRGFEVKSVEDFERTAASMCDSLFSEYGDLPREGVAGKVYTSTPYPPDKAILYHNESSHLSTWPGKISFFCITPATQGGATPVVDCRKVYNALDEIVRDKFERLGLLYVRNFCESLDVSWQRFFGTEDRAEVERVCRKQGMACEWRGSNDLCVKQGSRAVLRHPVTGEMSFFNQTQLHHVHCLDPEIRKSLLSIFGASDLPRNVYYGDGSIIEDSVLDHVGETYERFAVRFEWRKGDLITLDNMLVAHARDPYSGDRKIVVALGDMIQSRELP